MKVQVGMWMWGKSKGLRASEFQQNTVPQNVTGVKRFLSLGHCVFTMNTNDFNTLRCGTVAAFPVAKQRTVRRQSCHKPSKG